MNFQDVNSLEEAEFVVLVTDEDRRYHRQAQRRLAVVLDERTIMAWKRKFSEDVQAEVEFYAAKRAERRAKRAKRRPRKAFINAQLAGLCTISDDDPRWDDLWIDSDDPTSEEEEDGE